MIRPFTFCLAVCCVSLSNTLAAGYSGQDEVFPFAPAAGQAGTTAVHQDDVAIVAWASGYQELVYGDSVAEKWKTPLKALGPAIGDSFDVVSLGSGGQITLTFNNPIRNGPGADFAVFENSFSDTFLELGWVEVSTDGVHYVRFPNFSFTPEPTGSVDPTFVHGLASKYRQGQGTPFDLEELAVAYQSALAETDAFSPEFEEQLEVNYPHLNLEEIRYVRIIDIVGDGRALDAEGLAIYDPYPTSGSAGLDLEAVAVIHQLTSNGAAQTINFPEIEHRRLKEGALSLSGVASSGLAVSYDVLEGPAVLNGTTLSFSGYGAVVVQAVQPGDTSFAPATSITRSFHVAEELQHIYFEPVANQRTGASVPLNAQTTSGFTPTIEVVHGPSDVSAGFPPNQSLQTGDTTGPVILRAYQVGGVFNGVTYAPAKDVFMTLDVVSSSSSEGPIRFVDWQEANSISGAATLDSDFDGVSDFQEYAAGTNPTDPADRAIYGFQASAEGYYLLEVCVSLQALVRIQVQQNSDLSNVSGWADTLPEVIKNEVSAGNSALRTMTFKVSLKGAPANFWRIKITENN